MSRRMGLPIRVETDAAGLPVRFTWRGITRAVQVIGSWHLQGRWWDVGRQSNRWYYRLLIPDNQIVEVYRDTTSARL
jgi:hypothetical protein